MENVTKYFAGIDQELKLRKGIMYACMVFSLLVCISVVGVSFYMYQQSRNTVYIIDKGSTVMATIADGGAQRDLEIEDHVCRFHELMFNLAPSTESQKRSVDRALHMADRSVYDWWRDQSEAGYYQRLITANITQEIQIDSVKYSIQQYPYPARFYGKIYLTRESNITGFDFVSECQLIDVPRAKNNPHGLMIEKFNIVRYESMGTRKRK